MDEKLKRVLERSAQLQEAINDCAGSVYLSHVEHKSNAVESYVLVRDISKLKGLVYDRRADDTYGERYKWYHTDAYGFRIIGAVKG